MIRIVTVAGAAIVLLGLAAPAASAHTISGPKPTNYRSRVVAISPAVPGISARIVDLGTKFELTNRTSTEITVLGYEAEPYLRIGPERRLREPALAGDVHQSNAPGRNRSRSGVDTSPTAVPQWKKISSGHTARWHDHRIHWMSAQPPPRSRRRRAASSTSRSRTSSSSSTGSGSPSRSRSTGFPGRAVCRGSRRSSSCSPSACSEPSSRSGGACSPCSSDWSCCPTRPTRSDSRSRDPAPIRRRSSSSSAAASCRSRCGSPRYRRSSGCSAAGRRRSTAWSSSGCWWR